ncbi:dTDP-D-glucose 4,6-dehydratase-like [Hydractinia symbiolongicarpus]|uniref:dTDP-D-glucose 4,6-dehydratase-like n=1 Tax=Hydractinia symbiolongicarpus TaxID=13093 RepID=UPI00254C10E9|nr:dTDP-D-glucose 4,6-dehydratase-like [Hydractinia symbiolongicarpus]
MEHFEITLLVICVAIACTTASDILIFGGNGFLGSHLVINLLKKEHNITLVNRGNDYFNSRSSLEPFVQRIIACDRKTYLRETCKELLGNLKYDYVIDFSSYGDKEIEQVIDILQNRIGLYILISTDTVYEVREKKHEGRTVEEDAENKFEAKKIEDKINEENKYGASKIACEERLKEQRKRFGFPYVILRLADAIGERDNTLRWWTYQLFLKIHKALKIKIPLPKPIMERNFSMVYAKDVSVAIETIITNPGLFHDQIINLAFKEDVTLRSLFTEIGACLNITNMEFDYDENTAWFRYPSVEKGPIDITKAELIFDWKPTKFIDAAQQTCAFFENAMVEPAYAKEREVMLAEFIEEALPDDFTDDQLFSNSLIDAYGPLVFKNIDLGFDVDLDEKRIGQVPKEEL